MKARQRLLKTVISAMLLALGMVLPLLTSQIKEIGDSLLPMHIPVLLCGFICGWGYAGVIGLVLPFLRSVTFGMPPLYPQAVWMATELMTYGAVSGIAYRSIRGKRNVGKLYLSLIIAMISGRIVWGITKAILLGTAGKAFTVNAFIMGGFVDAVPGIILQLVLIPVIVKLYEKLNKRGSIG